MKEIFLKTHPQSRRVFFLICLKHKYPPKGGKWNFPQLHSSHLIALMDSLKESVRVIIPKSWTLWALTPWTSSGLLDHQNVCVLLCQICQHKVQCMLDGPALWDWQSDTHPLSLWMYMSEWVSVCMRERWACMCVWCVCTVPQERF